MKKNLLFIVTLVSICAVTSVFATTQNKELEKYITAANKIVIDYNAGNYVAIWKMSNQEIQIQSKYKDLEKFLENMKSELGKITELDKTPTVTPDGYVFKLHCNKKDLFMILCLNDNEKYSELFFLDQFPVIITYPKVSDKTTIDELANAYISQNVTAGLAIGIINNGKVSTHFYGVVENGTNIKPNKNTEFEIGSITKTFTAIALLEMQEQRLLNVNDPISKFLPKNIKTPTYDGKEITLESLVTQTSGLPRMPTNFAEDENDPQNPYANYTVKDLYNFLSTYKLTRAVGAEYEYSNLGFGLLGQILAFKANTSYEDVIKKEICNKLGMHDTIITLSPVQKKRLAQGYSTDGKPVKDWDFKAFAGAGALKSTITDMLIYLHANLTKSDSILGKAIQESHLVKVHPKHTDFEQASGWVLSKNSEHCIIWHNGGTGGYRSFIGFFKDTKTGVVVLSSSAVSVDKLGMYILERLAMDLPKKSNKELITNKRNEIK